MSQLHTEHVRALTAREKTVERTHVPPGTVSGGTHTLPRGHRKVHDLITVIGNLL